jgi:hypothetical protein
MPSAKAADLGGDCCADLEERVAELEATTARKGNRKVSLTVYGWVNKGILYWNDGHQSNTFLGVDNTNYGTRFGLRGDARVNPNVKAGFSLLLDVTSGATTSGVRRDREDRGLDVQLTAGGTFLGNVGGYNEDMAMRLRDANVWVEHTTLGRLTVGRLTTPGAQGIVDLGGVALASVAAIDLVGGSFQFRNSANAGATGVTGATIGNNTTGGAQISNRVDGLRWDSPTIGGFVIGAAWGEAAQVDYTVDPLNATSMGGPLGTYWAANLRYAGEFAGFRVAAAVGYEYSDGEETGSASLALGKTTRAEATNLGLSASLLHVPSGLFAQGSWIRFERPNLAQAGAPASDEGTLWHVQGGISQNWTGLGKTALYGEYARGEDLQRVFSPVTVQIAKGVFPADPAADVQAVNAENTYSMWGLGIVQNIDAAAMELYLAYRNHSLDRNAETTGANALADVNDIQTFMGGMRIGF